VKKQIFVLIIFLSSLLFVPMGNAQIFSDKDVKICKSKFKLAVNKNLENETIGDVIAAVGKSFIGTGYVEHTLEKGKIETLVIDLTGLDCTTFLENSLVFARLIKEHKNTFEDYEKELTRVRYRGGIINKYPSRLHYFSDWIYDNKKKGIVKDITKELGGVPIHFNLNFMTTHPDSYKRLKENPDFIPVIKKQEEEINKRTYYYIPKEKVDSIESKIDKGDLIAITTNIEGLDIGHVGIAVRIDDGKVHLLHAPIPGTKVQISELSLSEYLSKLKNDSGIIILKALEPDILPKRPEGKIR
jgi:N-acetylmuramoyl-L-alanine amidase-like